MLIIILMFMNELTANENIMPMHRMETVITIFSGLGFVPSLGSCLAGLSGRQNNNKRWRKNKKLCTSFHNIYVKNTECSV